MTADEAYDLLEDLDREEELVLSTGLRIRRNESPRGTFQLIMANGQLADWVDAYRKHTIAEFLTYSDKDSVKRERIRNGDRTPDGD